MAEAFLRRFAGDDVEVASAGTIAADRPDPSVVAATAEIDMDISCYRPKLIDPAALARADRIITMGCDVVGVPRVSLERVRQDARYVLLRVRLPSKNDARRDRGETVRVGRTRLVRVRSVSSHLKTLPAADSSRHN